MLQQITIGSRGSRLALVQAGMAASAIQSRKPELSISIKKITTTGDRDRSTALPQLGPAVFVKELEQALLDETIDLAVHSLKDVPDIIPVDLQLAAVLERDDPRDVLIARSSLMELPHGARIGTDSVRRSAQLKRCRRDLNPGSLRGNIETRLNKFSAGNFDGVITAAAALNRLGLAERITEYLSIDEFLPCPGQGAIVIESRIDNQELSSLIVSLNHLSTWRCVMAERAFAKTLGGGCHAPVAALASMNDGLLELRGMVCDLEGRRVLEAYEQGSPGLAEEIGCRLAVELSRRGAGQLIDEVISA